MAQSKMYVPRDFHYSARRRPAVRKKRRRNKRRLVVFAGAFVVLILGLVATLTFLLIYKDVRLEYSVELGQPLPEAQAFARSASVAVEYITDISTIDPSDVGSHWVHVSANGNDRLVNLVIKDTVPPKAEAVDTTISIKEQVTPEQLVRGLDDAGLVNLKWDRKPDFGKIGDYPTVITVRDLGGNVTTVKSMVRIRVAVDAVTVEAGGTLPELKDFLTDDTLNAKLITDISAIPTDSPGTHEVLIDVDGTTYKSSIVVKDTVAPDLKVKMFHVLPGGSAKPEDFVASVADVTAVTYKFAAEPDYSKTGHQDVSIIATDMGGNTAEKTAPLLVSDIAPINVEVRDTPLTAEEFNITGHGSVSLATEMVPDTLGNYDIELIVDGKNCMTMVAVVDTVPPKAEPQNISGFVGHPLTPEKFVKNVADFSEVTYSFAEEPDWSREGTQDVSVKLADASGNASEFNCALSLEKDTKAPELFGVKNRYCYIGEAVSYFDEVFAEDNCDEEVKIDVDNSEVNINQGGDYNVTYTAVDSSGNKAERTCTFTFIKETVTDEQIKEEARKVLDRIITDDMSIGQKAEAIFDYVQERIKYTNSSDKTNWKAEAYRGFTTGRGDCFTYFSLAKCLLQELGGVEMMDVERYGGNRPTRHFWLLINLGTGWYHYDTIDVGPNKYRCFMKTDAEVIAVDPNFYSWNREIVPATPTEPYKMN